MKKCKTFISVCTAFTFIVFMLSSCTSIEDDQVKEPTGVGSVRIKITRSGSAETRGGAGVSDPIEKGEDNAKLNISTGGHLYFVDANDNITKHVEILADDDDDDDDAEADGETKIELTYITGEGGGIIQNVPSSSSKVYIFLNLPDIGMYVTSGPFERVTSKVVTAVHLANPADGAFDVANVPVSGSGVLQTHERTDFEPYDLETATIQLKAIASRIEIPEVGVSMGGDNPNISITSFKLTGIFINNYYPSVTLGGTLDEDALQNAGSNPDSYDESLDDDFFWKAANVATTQGTYLYTTHATTVGSTIGYRPAPYAVIPSNDYNNPATRKVWGYNVFPEGVVPHIVFKFSEVVIHDYATDQDKTLTNQFVTVKGFKKAEGELITSLERGIVYKLGGVSGVFRIIFDNLSPDPEVTTIDALVTAEVIDWDEEEVDPVY